MSSLRDKLIQYQLQTSDIEREKNKIQADVEFIMSKLNKLEDWKNERVYPHGYPSSVDYGPLFHIKIRARLSEEAIRIVTEREQIKYKYHWKEDTDLHVFYL